MHLQLFYVYFEPNMTQPVEEEAIQILKQNDLKKTPARIFVLKRLLQSRTAISYQMFEKELKHLADRITLYRILKSFEEKGIIHKTFDHEGLPKYAMCQDACKTNHHYDHHVHFNCTQCKETICMETVDIPKITLPKGFKATSFAFSVIGVCRTCAK